METIGSRIKSLRKESKLTQQQLAKICGCSAQVISNIERDYSRPSTDLLNNIAECFNVPADYILGLTICRWVPDNPYYSQGGIPGKISACMDQLQMDMQTFIRSSNLDEETFDQIMRGEIKPNTDSLSRIAKALNTTVDFLIGNTEYNIAIASEEEQDIILYFRNMSKKQKRKFMGLIEQMVDE